MNNDFNQTKISDLINYSDNSRNTIKKFLRKIEKNQRIIYLINNIYIN